MDNNIQQLKGPILIFGASGFIGTNLLRNILRVRSDVYGVFHTDPNDWRLRGIPPQNLRGCDITDEYSLRSLIDSVRPQTVFNLSAYGAYPRQKDAQRIYDVNFTATATLLSLLKDRNVSAYVHAGTSSEYGLNCNAPSEKDALVPNSDYAVSKVACSYLIQYYGKQLGVPAVNLRLYSIYGPWEEPDRLIPRMLLAGHEGQYPPLVSPTISRDFVYVDDACNAFVLAAIKGCAEHKGESFNIASGQLTTIETIAHWSQKHFNITSAPVFANMENRSWDLSNWVGNPAFPEKALGWKTRTKLDDGLAATEQWLTSDVARVKLYKTFTPYMEPQSKKISAIIACYKDNQAIPYMYQRLRDVFRKLDAAYEIIFVNDASPDDTEEVIAKIAANDPNVIGITHSRNFGSQSAFLSGMGISTGDAVVLLDGDLQDPPELIEKFFEKWREGYDVVYGVRVKREMPFFTELFYKGFYRVFKRMANISIPADAGDFSIIDRRVVNELLKLPEKDVFLRGLRAWVGFKQMGVPYERPERMFGRSTNNLFKNIWWAKKGIFSFSQKPLEFLSYLGMTIVVFSIVYIVVQTAVRLLWPQHTPAGLTTIILLIALFGGVQILAISVVGEYISKVIEEVKGRPLFIRRSLRVGHELLNTPEQMSQYQKKVERLTSR